MQRRLIFVLLVVISVSDCLAGVDTNALLTPQQYNTMEPYLNNTLREKLRPADARDYGMTPQQAMTRMAGGAIAPVSELARAADGGAKAARSAGRTAAQNADGRRVIARSAAAPAANAARAAAPPRRVVARSRSASRQDGSNSQQRDSTAETVQSRPKPSGDTTPTQCIANYSDCMENYCRRKEARYDRCYCSARLAQIDAEYRPAIDGLVQRLAILQNGGEIDGGMTDQEIEDFWETTFGESGANSMASLNSALGGVDWTDAESSVRGQNAFIAGDNYCRQYLAGCYFMAGNMKDLYRTTIAKDCKTYETYLQKMKYAAEQAVSSYGD